MTCLNDVLVSVTLNELIVGGEVSLPQFSCGHFTFCHEIGIPYMLDVCLWHLEAQQ